MGSTAAAGQGLSIRAHAPDPQGGDRLVAYVLDQLRRPAATQSSDRLDAAGRDHYERKNRYMIEVFLADNTLVLYEKQANGVRRPAKTYRVATPAGDVEAPAGWGVITQIEFEPWWRPTENMKRRAKQKGRSLPDVMPPGVKNPMGPFKMHLSHGFAYRIHGNNDPKSIGRRVTNGCIRMRNDEGLELAKILDVGTEVVISAHASPTVGQGAEAIAPGP
jgi:lipoprotein-anchoring transpeptidase ErfK/SrfK